MIRIGLITLALLCVCTESRCDELANDSSLSPEERSSLLETLRGYEYRGRVHYRYHTELAKKAEQGQTWSTRAILILSLLAFSGPLVITYGPQDKAAVRSWYVRGWWAIGFLAFVAAGWSQSRKHGAQLANHTVLSQRWNALASSAQVAEYEIENELLTSSRDGLRLRDRMKYEEQAIENAESPGEYDETLMYECARKVRADNDLQALPDTYEEFLKSKHANANVDDRS